MSGEQVLIVDQNEHAAQALAELLSDEGYRVTVSPDTAQAMRLVKRGAPHLVFADRWCGGHDGIELLRKLASEPPYPVGILMSTTECSAVSCAGPPRIFQITKPLEFNEVARVARQAA
jgi:DNA-binding NtrC family response regulator